MQPFGAVSPLVLDEWVESWMQDNEARDGGTISTLAFIRPLVLNAGAILFVSISRAPRSKY
jgi:hypothetical protein